MKRVLITGGSGFLGARILQQGLGDAELCSLPRGFLAAAGEAEVTEAIQKLQPAAIVHAAALSDTGYCAQHPEEAHRANVELPVWVAKAACASGAKLLAFSSDQVYAGITQPGPLPETLPLQPTNVYGRCKLEMEQRVLELCPDAVLLRASWMYDLPGYGHFKGKEYEVLGVARHSETEEEYVVYRQLYGEHSLWVRPASMWNEMVTRDGKTQRRFTYVGEEA